jgi:uncharacterized DUF497 family protein
VQSGKAGAVPFLDFEWDPTKAAENESKHGVSFYESCEVFGDESSYTVFDAEHSLDEERFIIFGRTNRGRYLAVGFTERGARIRIITARPMTRRERSTYEH